MELCSSSLWSQAMVLRMLWQVSCVIDVIVFLYNVCRTTLLGGH